MNLFLYTCISLLGAWTWMDYYRRIDVFHKQSLKHTVLGFAAGAALCPLVFPITDYLIDPTGWQITGEWINDLVYSITAIGFVEELVKGLPLLALLLWKRDELHEPLDYLYYAALSAMGFACVENILYAWHNDVEVLYTRTIMCTVTHVIDSTIWAYGFVLVRFSEKHRNRTWVIPLCMLLAAVSHGIYDFLLIDDVGGIGFFLTLLYFMLTVSVYATIMGNALNNSPFFTYKKAVDSVEVQNKLVRYYFILFVLVSFTAALDNGLAYGIANLISSLRVHALLLVVVILRSCRFKFIQHRWNPVKLELPFYYASGDGPSVTRGFTIKGSAYNEVLVAPFYQELSMLCAWTRTDSFMYSDRPAYIFEKRFLHNDEVFYHTRIFMQPDGSVYKDYLLFTRKKGTTSTNEDYPVCALLEYEQQPDQLDDTLTTRDFAFVAWVFLRPLTEEERVQLERSSVFGALLLPETVTQPGEA